MRENNTRDNTGFTTENAMRNRKDISVDGLLSYERIREILMMSDRKMPVYQDISSFSIALYALGYSDCPDLMSFADIDAPAAARILEKAFFPIGAEALPPDYKITESGDKYLLVIGDPRCPLHFAVLTDVRSDRPFFSKLPFFGSGFDSLAELVQEFSGQDGNRSPSVHYYRKGRKPEKACIERGRIFIVKD
ncbi:MAG: hypothetical protein CSA22_05970 [Deltaproteobacteria bacterium]|nr:MAG: hypothetical protein CSA22_05970 [Deltaproteobacteria bacterium]